MPSIHPDRILYQDDHLLVVNKLAGELTVAASGEGDKLALADFLKKDFPGLRVVHRLDYGTSGAIVFAKSAAALEKIRESNFAGWNKTYHAIVAGMPEKPMGTIRKPLKARTHEGLVDAVTHIKVLFPSDAASLVEAKIHTGRKHQIRQHLAAIGHPLVCDPLYGNPKADRGFRLACKQRRFLLHSAELSFPHPITGKLISVTAKRPQSFESVLKALGAKR